MQPKGSLYFSLVIIIIFLVISSQFNERDENKENVFVDMHLSMSDKVESLESVSSGSIIETKTKDLFILNYYDSYSENFEVSNLHKSIHLNLNDENGISFLSNIKKITDITDTVYIEKLKHFIKQNINKSPSN
ncbi:MAG: hypothetical protein WDZ80_07425 [Candidatus Paceibacterota bacterium]